MQPPVDSLVRTSDNELSVSGDNPNSVSSSADQADAVALSSNVTDDNIVAKKETPALSETDVISDGNSHEADLGQAVEGKLQASAVDPTNSSTRTEQQGVSSQTIYRIVDRFRSGRVAIAALSLLTGVVLWHLASSTNFNYFINFENVPAPFKVFMAFVGHLQTEVFYIHIGVSMRRILISYTIAVVIGICLGLLMGRSKFARSFIMPYIEVIRPIPAVAWIPLAILMWPTEESSIIYITFLGALFPIVLNTLHGVEQTPEVLVRAAQSLGASRISIFLHVVLPAALPSIAAGLAIGMGVSWFSLLAGEIISGQYGIGYFTWDAYSLINYQDIVVGMLVIGFLGTASTAAVRLITNPMLKWQKRTR